MTRTARLGLISFSVTSLLLKFLLFLISLRLISTSLADSE